MYDLTDAQWWERATCSQVGIEMWFPSTYGFIEPGVLQTCATCPVREQCLWLALECEAVVGIWAALVPAELWELRWRIAAGEAVEDVVADGLAIGAARASAQGAYGVWYALGYLRVMTEERSAAVAETVRRRQCAHV